MYNLVIGLDISKSTLDACCVRFASSQYQQDAFLNKPLGFKQLSKWINSLKSPDDKMLICMEHTGHYAYQLNEFLAKQNFDVTQINPLKIKRSMGLRREKSDRADAKTIALYGLKFQEEIKLNGNSPEQFTELQLLLAQRKRIQEKMLAFQRQQKYLNHCLSGKLSRKIAKDLLRLRKLMKKEMLRVDSYIEQFLQQHQQIKDNYLLLQSIPGVGPIISLYTILHTQNFTQIKCPRKFACYCGVAPFKNESGTSVRKGTRVSFYANRKLKAMLNFGAMNAVRCDPQLKAYYQKKTAQKGNKMLVLNAVRNKIIHRMFAVIKRQSAYVVNPVF